MSKDREQKLDLYEEDIYEQKDKEEAKICLINFRLGKEWYGIEVTKAMEVARVSEVTYLPSVPDYVIGVVNLRGNILAVVDLKGIFGLTHESSSGQSRLIVLEIGNNQLVLLADEVSGVMDIPITKIEPVLNTLEPEKARYIKGEYKLEDRLLAILDVEKLFAK